jgi:hypothetical protein
MTHDTNALLSEFFTAMIRFVQALCSARRWQKFGVVYTTLVNALLVHRYTSYGWTADEIFDYYYRRPSKKQE